jgi:hypothetical protein
MNAIAMPSVGKRTGRGAILEEPAEFVSIIRQHGRTPRQKTYSYLEEVSGVCQTVVEERMSEGPGREYWRLGGKGSARGKLSLQRRLRLLVGVFGGCF